MNSHVDGRAAGAALQSLSREQIRSLVLLARRAFAAEFPPTDEPFDAWRHRQCQMAVERPGLTACRNEDFLPLKAHFLRLLGDEAGAEEAQLRASGEARRQAWWGLERACNAAADVLPAAWQYASGFMRNKRGCGLDDADAKALRHAAYVVSRKAAALRAQGAAA